MSHIDLIISYKLWLHNALPRTGGKYTFKTMEIILMFIYFSFDVHTHTYVIGKK